MSTIFLLTGGGSPNLGGGQLNGLFVTAPAYQGREMQVSVGTAATPDTTLGPVIKADRYLSIVPGAFAGAGPEQMSAIEGICVGDVNTAHQPLGILGVGINYNGTNNPGNDALGVQGFGYIKAGATGFAIGLDGAGKRDDSGGNVSALQLSVQNFATQYAAAFRGKGISDTVGIWMETHGGTGGAINGSDSAAGIQFGNPYGYQFQAGIHFNGEGASIGTPTTTAASGTGAVSSLSLSGASVTVAIPAGTRFRMSNDPNSPAVVWTATARAAIGATSVAVSPSVTPVPITIPSGGTLLATTGPVWGASIQDDGDALQSIAINGSYANGAIAIAPGSGAIIVGETVPGHASSLLELVGSAVDSNPLLFMGSPANANSYTISLRNSIGNHEIGVASSTHVMLGSPVAAGDFVIHALTASRVVYLGGTQPVIAVGNDNTLGFFAVGTRAAQQTFGAKTAAAAYGSNEQTMLQTLWNSFRAYGLGS